MSAKTEFSLLDYLFAKRRIKLFCKMKKKNKNNEKLQAILDCSMLHYTSESFFFFFFVIWPCIFPITCILLSVFTVCMYGLLLSLLLNLSCASLSCSWWFSSFCTDQLQMTPALLHENFASLPNNSAPNFNVLYSCTRNLKECMWEMWRWVLFSQRK